MSLCKYPKALLRFVDFFYSNQILRYNDNPQYKTITGGIISIITIITILIGFSQMIKSTFSKTSITSTLEVKKNLHPTKLQVAAGQDRFMIGIFVSDLFITQYFDLVNGPHIFDIKTKIVTVNNTIENFEEIELQQCTLEHWQNNPVMNHTYLNLDRWLCLKMNEKIRFQGAYFSEQQGFLQFSLKKCQNSTSNQTESSYHKICASPEQIQSVFNTYSDLAFSHVFMDSIINPNQPNHVQYFLNRDHYVVFSNQLGAESWIFLQDYTIITDNSILPYQDYQTEKGFIAEDRIRKNVLSAPKDGELMAIVVFSKSENSFVYFRQFRKLSAVISYIGSLVGAVIMLLFLIKFYTNCALEINISLDLFQQIQGLDQNTITKFNFINFLSMYFYKIAKYFKIGEKFIISKKLNKYKDEVKKQLDIKILLRRIIKLQDCMKHVLNQEQIKLINQKIVTYQIAKTHRNLLAADDKRTQSQTKSSDLSKEQKKQTQFRNQTKYQKDSIIQNHQIGREINIFKSQSQKHIYHGLQINLNGYENHG